jgi:lipopolysaccharide export system ATP-binding protein
MGVLLPILKNCEAERVIQNRIKKIWEEETIRESENTGYRDVLASNEGTIKELYQEVLYQKEKLESLITEFRLQKVRKNLGDQLSGGERRRTEIARCLAIDPKFIMLDEPFAGVDPIAVEDIQHIVWKLKDKNIGILITDHNALETLRLTDRAYLLFDGRILFQGTPEELANNPVVREKYLGSNFVLTRKDFQLSEEMRNKRLEEQSR